MPEKIIASLLMCAVVLLTAAPPRVFAQTPARSGMAGAEQPSGETQARPRPALKAFISEEISRIKAEGSKTGDLKTIRKARQDAEDENKPRPTFTKKEKILLIVFILGMAVLIPVLAIKGVDNPTPFCADDPSALDCIP